MKKNLALLLLIFFLFSCRSTQNINKAIAPKESAIVLPNKDHDDSVKMVKDNYSQFKQRQIDFKTFNAKIKVESSGNNGKNPDLTAVVKIFKDSAIWISLSASLLNVEVYRVLITKDSVILLDKREKEVSYRSLDYLQDVTQIPFDFTTLQNLIIGNPIFVSDSIIAFRKNNNNLLISTIDAYFKNLLTISGESKLLLHSKMDDIDLGRSRTADITYDGYQSSDGYLFSTDRTISVSEKTKLDISLNFKQFEFNKELSVVFNVPKNYKLK